MMGRSWVGLISLLVLMSSEMGLASHTDPKAWTMLVFLNGHNNLDSYGTEDINEMEKVGSTDKINVVVQWASSAASRTKRLLVKKDGDVKRVGSPILQDLSRVDMGDSRSLVDFVKWGVAEFPAEHYFVVVWNHGSGWRLNQKTKSLGVGAMNISYDDISGHSISTVELGLAMAEISRTIGKKIDIYGSDACLMAMAEIGSEMSDSVKYFVGSQDLEPGDGWPYDDFLRHWNSVPSASAADVSKILVEEYFKSYSKGSQGDSDVTLSALDLGQMPTFEQSVRELGRGIAQLDRPEKDQVVKSISKTLTFAYADYGDFGNFIKQIKMPQAVRAQSALSRLVIASSATERFAGATGLSIWLPWSSGVFGNYEQRYLDLGFHRKSGWGDALRDVLVQ